MASGEILLNVLTQSSSFERSNGRELNGNQKISTAQLLCMISRSFSSELKNTGHVRIEVARFYDYFMVHLNGKIQIS